MQPIKIVAAAALVATAVVHETSAQLYEPDNRQLVVTLYEKPNFEGASQKWTAHWAGSCYDLYECGNNNFGSAKWSIVDPVANAAANGTNMLILYGGSGCNNRQGLWQCTVPRPNYSKKTCEQLGGVVPTYPSLVATPDASG